MLITLTRTGNYVIRCAKTATTRNSAVAVISDCPANDVPYYVLCKILFKSISIINYKLHVQIVFQILFFIYFGKVVQNTKYI